MTADHASVRLLEVTKAFGQKVVLEAVNLAVAPGEICGLMGRNGSGKTTLLRIICGLVRPTSGQVIVLGENIAATGRFPADVGAIIEHPGFLPQYTGKRNLEFLAMIRGRIGMPEIEAAMRRVGLDPDLRTPVGKYSLGMRQRLGIAQAIMERPKVLVLDEPTSALDERGVEEVHTLLRQLRDDGVAIVLTSHDRDEIQQLCDSALVLEGGRLKPLG